MRNLWMILPCLIAACAVEQSGREVDEDVGEIAQAQKSGAHFVGTPTCTQSGGNLVCTGSIAGLGNTPVTVDASVTSFCTNNGGNNPPGQVSGTSGPISPRSGRINFTVLVSGGCPGKMTTSFVSPATVTVYQNGEVVFTGNISF